MKAALNTASGVTVSQVAEPDSDAGVLIEVRAVSICASDMSYLRRGSVQVAGHEIAGVTPDGTPVAVHAVAGCGVCEYCRRDEANLCERAGVDILGLTVAGGMSQRFAVPSWRLIPLPQGLAVENASIVEPGAVAWHACVSAGVGPDSRVAVVGGGAIGQFAVVAAQRLGAREVVLEARHPYQQELGTRLGADRAHGTYDAVVEAAGTESALARAMELARPKGTVATVGVYPGGITWPYREAFRKEVRTVPSMGYIVADTRQVATMLAERPDLASALITHRFSLDDVGRAFETAADRAPGTFKVVVHP